MKVSLFSVLIATAFSVILSCQNDDYRRYNQLYVSEARAMAEFHAIEDGIQIWCQGLPENGCEMNGPHDGLFIPMSAFEVSLTKRDTVYLTTTQRDDLIFELEQAYENESLDSLLQQNQYDVFFTKASNRAQLISDILDGTYTLSVFDQNEGFAVINISQATPVGIYLTYIFDPGQ